MGMPNNCANNYIILHDNLSNLQTRLADMGKLACLQPALPLSPPLDADTPQLWHMAELCSA